MGVAISIFIEFILPASGKLVQYLLVYSIMRLLVLTQIIDPKDSVLGIYHKWVASLAQKFEHIEVICLTLGKYDLPKNVTVQSLGKEKASGSHFFKRLKYVFRFYFLIWSTRRAYDAVFVHMNQEYILLGGLLWKALGKKIYMWRNHYAGSFLTDIAASMCDKVFCTSRFSYTATYKKTIIMPVGVDLESVKMDISIERLPRSIIFSGRLDSSKRPHLLIKALSILKMKGVTFDKATFMGGPSKSDASYPEELRIQAEKGGIGNLVEFVGAIPNTETFRYYRSRDIYVNCSRSGMFDKTIFKALASGCTVLTSSIDFKDLAGDEYFYKDGDAEDLAQKLEKFLQIREEE